MKKICIIGNGIAGITAARHIRKQKSASEYQITVISAETDYFYSRTALMYIYMGHMTFEHTKPYEDWFWDKNDINLVRDYVYQVDTEHKLLRLKNNKDLAYDILILATGSKRNRAGWQGEQLKGVQGMISIEDIELMEENTRNIRKAVIVGGGLIGVEMAECLHSRHIPVTFLVREDEYWHNVLPLEEARMASRHIRDHGIDLRTKSELKEICGDETGNVKSVITTENEEIPCQFVGVTIGVMPNIDFLQDSAIETDRGIVVNEFLETNIPGVFAVGDCAQHRMAPSGRKKIEQIWYSGRMQGETVAQTVCEKKTKYIPGVFFNSAKLFNIEYQVYGTVHVEPAEDEEHFYWEHKGGEKSVRIVFEKETGIVRGFNLMGIRYKHAVCDRWIKERTNIVHVMAHLKEANFDPEFYKRYEDEIIAQFRQKYPDRQIKSGKKKGLIAAIFGF